VVDFPEIDWKIDHGVELTAQIAVNRARERCRPRPGRRWRSSAPSVMYLA
jgi:hypothetical protein